MASGSTVATKGAAIGVSPLAVDLQDKARESASSLLQLVSFSLDEEVFGIEILHVQEIIRMVGVTYVPNAPPFVKGVINLRGRIIPVIALRERLGFPPTEPTKHTRILVVELSSRVIGFVVDAVSEVLRVPTETIEDAPTMASTVDAAYIVGVVKLPDKLMILLDLERLVAHE
ncbi:MAG: chemotaxis protein CheW [Chloroflexota bacterium]|nr:MAG: chemotaxis protein CheW [Chloroflexota bacterium]